MSVIGNSVETRPDRFIRALDIRVKLLGFLVFLSLAFIFEHPFYQLGLALLVAVIARSIRFPFRKIRALLLPLLPLFVLIILITGLTSVPDRFHLATSRAILGYLLPGHRLGVIAGGVMLGLTFMIRIGIMVSVSALFTFIAPLDDMMQVLQKLKVPYEVSFIILTALRFIPTLDRKRLMILDAQKARGANFRSERTFGWLRAQIPVMIPLIINSIHLADAFSMAMLNRGFGYANTRTVLRQLSLTRKDWWTGSLILMVLGCVLYLRFGRGMGII